jgi:hypothetical protein
MKTEVVQMTNHHSAANGTSLLDTPSARPIDELECTAILARHDVGRLAIVGDDELDIFPVHYVVDGHWAIVSVPPEIDLSHVSMERVALEVDEVDGDGERTIVIHGLGRDITASLDETSIRERTIAQVQQATAGKARSIRIIPRQITGRETPANAY